MTPLKATDSCRNNMRIRNGVDVCHGSPSRVHNWYRGPSSLASEKSTIASIVDVAASIEQLPEIIHELVDPVRHRVRAPIRTHPIRTRYFRKLARNAARSESRTFCETTNIPQNSKGGKWRLEGCSLQR
jgi:hypothetical protein